MFAGAGAGWRPDGRGGRRAVGTLHALPLEKPEVIERWR